MLAEMLLVQTYADYSENNDKGTHFTCCTSTKVQTLTPELADLKLSYSVYLL
jgi:hypothetical protein